MKLTDKQALALVMTLRDTLRLLDGNNVFTYPRDIRTGLFNDIIEQQGSEIIDLAREVKP
jgi:hypothetical protein